MRLRQKEEECERIYIKSRGWCQSCPGKSPCEYLGSLGRYIILRRNRVVRTEYTVLPAHCELRNLRSCSHSSSLWETNSANPFISGLIWQRGHLTKCCDCDPGESFVAEDDVSEVRMRQQGSMLQGSVIDVWVLDAGTFVPLSLFRH